MRVLMTALLVVSGAASAPGATTVPVGENVTVKGVPGVPEELARAVDRYGDYRTAQFAAWHPRRLEMLVLTRFGNTTQVHRVSEPGGRRMQVTFFAEPVRDVSAWFTNGDNDYFAFLMDEGGDEFYQLYSFDNAARTATRLSDGVKRNGSGVYSETAGLLAYPRVDADERGAFTQVRLVDPLKPGSDKLLTTVRGGGWRPSDWSPDGQRLLALEYVSINDSRLWEIEASSGQTKLVSPQDVGQENQIQVAHGGADYAADNVVYFTSDQDSEFRQLVRWQSGRRKVLTDSSWDVEGLDVSTDGQRVAYVTNERGQSVLHVIETKTGRELDLPKIPTGVFGALRWHNDGRQLAFSVSSASIPGDVFVLEVGGKLQRWTSSESAVDTTDFVEPDLIEWTSFDGRTITGFLYRPPARFTGKRPVILNIHGGPEGQSRPQYLGRRNYFLNELGCAVIYPNVRGSRGFGKTFLKLDNGLLREGTHKDVKALLDWIGSREDLDEQRIMVRGGSYGGYMTLSAAYRFSDRIRCAVDLVGISNLRTFLENTQGYRRDLRRVEYGDERIANLREWMDSTSALRNADKIRKPLLVLQGANDPRVPKSESDQIVAALEKTGTPVWYVVFKDEGHGFRKKANADYAFYATVLFTKRFLLRQRQGPE